MESAVWQLTIFVFICKTDQSKPVKQEVNGTVILPPLVFPGLYNPGKKIYNILKMFAQSRERTRALLIYFLSFYPTLLLSYRSSYSVAAVFVVSNTNRRSSNRFDTNSDWIPNKKINKLFVLFCNYLFPDQSNSAKMYVVQYSSKLLNS